MSKVAHGETNTRGIVEQRAVDVITAALHFNSSWKSRGLGDSVNAANTPRRKLGDCEYQDASSRTVHAYEAHAGHLSKVYFRNHHGSLEGILRLRLDDEWLAYSEPSDWTVTVTFAAHSTDLAGAFEEEIEGVRVRFEFVTYSDLIARIDTDNLAVQTAFDRWLLQPLNHPRSPQSVRDRVLELAK
jgi:hypothetical protein